MNFSIPRPPSLTATRGRKDTSIIPIQYSLDKDEFALELHWFTEEEIEEQLAKLLRSYRRFYAAPDSLEDEASAADGDASQAAAARDALNTIFVGRLDLVLEGDESWDGGEGKDFLLLQEEEDVLNAFMMWIREMAIPSQTHVEVIQDMRGCISRLMQLTVEPASSEGSQKTAAFIKKITLPSNSRSNRLPLDDLPGVRGSGPPTRSAGGALSWDYADIFCGLEQSEREQLRVAWENFRLRDDIV